MIREEYITSAGSCFERLLGAIQELPAERFELLLDGGESVHELFAELSSRAERMVRALDVVMQQRELRLDELTRPIRRDEWKRTLAGYQIAHSTLLAALERVPLERFHAEGELPNWLLDSYLVPLERALPRVEAWAAHLRERGLGGPTGLPVIQK